MAIRNLKRMTVLLLCMGISVLLCSVMRRSIPSGIKMSDFGAVYYGARCAVMHEDPYDPGVVLREFTKEGGTFPSNPVVAKVFRIAITICVNLPTALFLAVPFALLPWQLVQFVWIILIALLLVLAAFLIWDLMGNTAPAVVGFLAAFVLANSGQVLTVGNPAGVAVSLCIIGSWCFLNGRYEWVGVLLLAVSLVLKPHDAGFVWLYFFLTGGQRRSRAIQTLVVSGVLGLLAALWIAPVSPHWIQELHSNITLAAGLGNANDPGPTGLVRHDIGAILDLQATMSIFRNEPAFYNRASFLISGNLILIWILATVRVRITPERTLLGLAAISALLLLPVYHRPYDAKMLLLALPACAMLWTDKGGIRRWLALGVTAAGIFITSDIPQAFLVTYSNLLQVPISTWWGKLVTALVLEPTPLVLLAMGTFYLWVYISYTPRNPDLRDFGEQPVTAS